MAQVIQRMPYRGMELIRWPIFSAAILCTNLTYPKLYAV